LDPSLHGRSIRGGIGSFVNAWPMLLPATLGDTSTSAVNQAPPRHAPIVVPGIRTFALGTRSTTALVADFTSIGSSLELGTTSSLPMAWPLGGGGMGCMASAFHSGG